MNVARKKANVGMTLLILFVLTLISGIILHLKSHGIVIEPRPLIKIFHWVSGFAMVAFACWHGTQFWKMFSNMKKKFRWFWCDTWVVMFFTLAAFISGLIKLLSPVKIPHLGLWHYWFGILLTVFVCIHLIRGIPGWVRLRKIK